jgi:MFS transporter, DHA1 family, inner membrane transport protein
MLHCSNDAYANLPLVSAALALLAVAVAVMSQALDRPASATIRQAPAE